MGFSTWDSTDWTRYTTSTSSMSRSEIFKNRGMKDELNPLKFSIRESRDSAKNPKSNPIIVAADVTGSMGSIAETLVRKSIGTTFEEILKRSSDPLGRMISDPHMLVMGIGDVRSDQAPVQATQFETDITIAKQLEDIYLEGNGGGNNTESYDAAWYFAATRTKIDSYEKRGKKGYLFTIGDEESPVGITKEDIKKFFGDSVESNLNPEQLLAMAEEKYDIFHIIVEEGNYARRRLDSVKESWGNILGQRVLSLSDITKLGEVIISAIQMNEGMSLLDLTNTWDGRTAAIVAKAVGGIKAKSSNGVGQLVRF